MFNFVRRAGVGIKVLFFCAACGTASHSEHDSAASGGSGAQAGAAVQAGSGSETSATAGGTAGDGSEVGGAPEDGGAAEISEGGAAGASAPDGDAGVCASRFATSVESFTPGTGSDFGQSDLPGIVLGPPKGGGTASGSLDVATLGNGGSITLGFAPSVIVDRPGPDFIVFENPFDVNGDPTKPFAELGTVEVSDDGRTFYAFPCTATSYPYGSCAGWHPVLANADTNTIDPTDPAVAGGDDFDLADLGLSEARFVRITDRVDQTGTAGTFDLDAVSIVHAACP